MVEPSLDSEKAKPINESGAVTRAIARVAGSTRNRWLAVFCRPEKAMPAAVQSSRFASSSKSFVTTVGVPPCAGMTAIRPLAW